MSGPRRFARPCSGCRSRRIACFPGTEVHGPCHRCESRGSKCDAPDSIITSPERDGNELAEMRAQISRLDNLLHTLTSSGQSPPSSNAPSPSSSMSSDWVEINDLIGAMTNLCFATEGLDGPISDTEDLELVHEASKVLAKEKVDELPPGGFNFQPEEPTDSLEAVIAELPPWEECSRMLTMYSRRWYSMNDSLFTPYWYESIEQLYATNFKSLRTPCQLAEIFGVLAITRSGQAIERGDYPKASKFSSSEAERFAKALRRALNLGDYYEKPCFEAVRSLHLISTLHLLWATSTTHFSCGFAIIPAALSMAMQLGLLSGEIDRDRPEEAWEAYERRATITGLVRNDWTYPPSYGRPSSSTPSMIGVEPPEPLRDEDLPPHMHNSSWRASPKTIQGLRARYLFAKLHREMVIDLFASTKTCDYSAVEAYAERLRRLEEEEMPIEWRRTDDPQTGRQVWVIPTPLSQREDAVARLYAVPKLCKVGMALHRPFVGPKRQDDIVNEAWHRREMIRWARMSFGLLPEGQLFTRGPFVSMTCSVFDTLIGLCLVVKSYPDEPLIDLYRDELLFCIKHLHHPTAPPAVAKLTRLTMSLLDRPKLKTDEEGSTKRARGRTLEQGLTNAPARIPSLSPDGSNDAPSFDFALPVTPPNDGSVEEELPHKRPLDSDFDRLAPLYHARTFNQISNASSGLDMLSTVAAQCTS